MPKGASPVSWRICWCLDELIATCIWYVRHTGGKATNVYVRRRAAVKPASDPVFVRRNMFLGRIPHLLFVADVYLSAFRKADIGVELFASISASCSRSPGIIPSNNNRQPDRSPADSPLTPLPRSPNTWPTSTLSIHCKINTRQAPPRLRLWYTRLDGSLNQSDAL